MIFTYLCNTRTRQASSQCLNRRVVFLYMRYTKQYSSPSELLVILENRGLDCSDTENAEHILRSIGYYRLSGYLYPFLKAPKSEHIYKSDSTLGKALSLYEFDHELRLLLFNQIERIEIAVRSAITNIACEETEDVFWMSKPEYFANSDKFNKTIQLVDKEIQASREDFILHFKESYEEPYPPSWMIAEIIPLGTLTRVYENISSNQIRKKIARYFGLSVPVFISWMTIITLTRNSCCHHARLWNRSLSLRALTMTRPLRPWLEDDVQQGRVFFTLCILKHFIDIIRPDNDFKQNLLVLLEKYPMIDTQAMGFVDNWLEQPLWEC